MGPVAAEYALASLHLKAEVWTKTETSYGELLVSHVKNRGVLPGQRGGGCEIRTREGLHPTRFPSVRPRPLGESSAGQLTGQAPGHAPAGSGAGSGSRHP